MNLHIPDTVIWHGTGEGVSLYHTETGQFLTLNTCAAQIWALLDGDGDRDSVVTRLTLLYGGSATAISGRIRADVDAFVDSMLRDGLLAESDTVAA